MSEPMDTESGSLNIFEAPQCLIASDKDGKLSVNEAVVEQVAALEKDLVIVSIAGLYRTGKSYLMNRLAGKNTGFSLGNTIQAMTKGIWLWARVHPRHPDCYLVLLDTEGLGDVKKGDATHDTWIFCLATLLPSLLVFNAMGTIDDRALEKLNFISKMSDHIRTRETTKKEAADDFDYFFPDFIYVLRDFHLDTEIDGIEVTPDEYLEDCLTLKPENGGSAKRFNNIRRCIRRYFRNRKCFTFDRPGNKRQLKQLETLSDCELSPDFVEEATNFCNHVFENAPVKKLENNQSINGRMWTVLVTTYVEAIRSNAVPCIENAVNSMAVIENSRAVQETVAKYKELVAKNISLPTKDDQELSIGHGQALKEAIKFFLTKAIFDDDNAYQEQANERILAEYRELVKTNEMASQAKCVEVLKSLEQPLMTKLQNGEYSKAGGYQEYMAAVQDVSNKYNDKKGLGVKAEEVLLDYMQHKLREGETIMAADKQISEKEKKAVEEKQKALLAEQEATAAKRERELVEQQARESEKALRENIKQIEEKNTQEIAALKAHQDSVIQSRLDEQKRLLQENFNSEAAQLRQQIEELKNRPPVVHRRRGRKGCVIQ